jgi:hypothetical protein
VIIIVVEKERGVSPLIPLIVGLLLVLNIIFTNLENNCNQELDEVKDDRTYDYFNLLRLYLIEDTQFEGEVSERIVNRTLLIRENTESCEKWDFLSNISVYSALILNSLLLVFYMKNWSS